MHLHQNPLRSLWGLEVIFSGGGGWKLPLPLWVQFTLVWAGFWGLCRFEGAFVDCNREGFGPIQITKTSQASPGNMSSPYGFCGILIMVWGICCVFWYLDHLGSRACYVPEPAGGRYLETPACLRMVVEEAHIRVEVKTPYTKPSTPL